MPFLSPRARFLKSALLLLIFFGISLPSFSVSQRWIDSVMKIMNGTQADTFRIDAAMKLTTVYLYSDPEKAGGFARKSLSMALASGDLRRIGNAHSGIGNVFYTQGEYDSALVYYRSAQKDYERCRGSAGLATALNNIGLVYINMGDYGRGLEYQFRSLKIREEIRDSVGIAYNYNAIGVVYLQKGDNKNALIYQQKSLEMNEKRKDKRGVMTNENNIGNIYYNMAVYDKALEFQLRALKGAQEINDVNGMANATGNLGNVFFRQGLWEKALDYYERSIGYQKQIDDKAGMCSNYITEAEVFRAQKKFDLSIDADTKAMDLAKETGARDLLKNAYRGLAEAYEALGDHASAYQYLFSYSDLRDTINEQENKRNMAEMQARVNSDNQEKQIAMQQQQLQIKDLEVARKQNIQNFTVIGLVLVMVLALLLYNRYRIKQKANAELEAAYHLIEDKNKDIMDSINYARRIQQNLLPSERYISKNLDRLKGQ